MAFSDSIRTLATQIEERRRHVTTEEATKHALILPLLAVLGYDIHNPAEVVPEYQAGWARSSEKIDYALLIEGKPALFVEAKGYGESLATHDPQLAKYFNSRPDVRFAVITNGVQYRFFTDLQERNILDRRPFFEFDLTALKDADISVLERFRREVFSTDRLVGYAEDLVYLSSLKNQFKSLLRDPSEEFVRFAVAAANLAEGRVTQRVVERFRPLVQESLSAAILEIVGQSLLPAADPVPTAELEAVDASPAAQEEEPSRGKVETTEEELKAFECVSRIVADHVPAPDKLQYHDTTGYLAVQYAKRTGWFARFCIQGCRKKHVCLRLPAEQVQELAPGYTVERLDSTFGACRVFFQSVEDLEGLGEVFIRAAKAVV